MSEFGAGQTLSGRVLRAMSRRSAQVVGESFRFVHDPGPLDRWLFDRLGERVVAVYEIEGQPRVGPIRVYDRAVVSGLDPRGAGERFFEGNRWRGLLSDPRTFPLTSREGTRTPEAIESMRAALASAQEHNSKTEFAPQTKVEGDVLWSLDPAVDWFGVRFFARDAGGVDHEQLCLMSIRNAYWEHWHRDWVELTERFARDEAARQGRELIAWEAMQATLQLNNASVFIIERRTRLSDEEYEERYIR